MRKSPDVCYRNYRYYIHNEAMNKENAKYLLNTLAKVFENNDIKLILAYGTLLGAIRERDFIGHDCDMDTMIWGKDMQKALDLVPELAKYDIQLECYVLPWILTYSYKGVTCDIDTIFDAPKPFHKRYCLIQGKFLPRAFFDNTKKIEFQGIQHIVPADTEKVLVYHYGKTWRIPGGAHARFQSKLFFWLNIEKFISRVKRYLKRHLDKKNIHFSENDISKVLNNLKKQGYEQFSFEQIICQTKKLLPEKYKAWLNQFKGKDTAEQIINQQLFRFIFNRHGSLGIILLNFNGNTQDSELMKVTFKWLKD